MATTTGRRKLAPVPDGGTESPQPGPATSATPDLPKDAKPGSGGTKKELSGAAKRKIRAEREARAEVSATVGEITPTIEALLLMFGRGWQIRDPVCGTKLVELTPSIAREVSALIDVNDKAAKFFNETVGNPGAVRLLVTVFPLLTTIGAHHIAPAIQARREAAAFGGDGLHYSPPPEPPPVAEEIVPAADNSFVPE